MRPCRQASSTARRWRSTTPAVTSRSRWRAAAPATSTSASPRSTTPIRTPARGPPTRRSSRRMRPPPIRARCLHRRLRLGRDGALAAAQQRERRAADQPGELVPRLQPTKGPAWRPTARASTTRSRRAGRRSRGSCPPMASRRERRSRTCARSASVGSSCWATAMTRSMPPWRRWWRPPPRPLVSRSSERGRLRPGPPPPPRDRPRGLCERGAGRRRCATRRRCCSGGSSEPGVSGALAGAAHGAAGGQAVRTEHARGAPVHRRTWRGGVRDLRHFALPRARPVSAGGAACPRPNIAASTASPPDRRRALRLRGHGATYQRRFAAPVGWRPKRGRVCEPRSSISA